MQEKKTELKTLKDIDMIVDCAEDHLSRRKIRQEAIKWISEIENFDFCIGMINMKVGDMEIDDGDNGYSLNAIKILKHIFNITEEDLK